MEFPDWSKKTILVVEDEAFTRFFYNKALQLTGVNLLFAENGAEGMKMATENKEIDCVLMDIRMPIADGYEATRMIKSIKKDLPIIVQTAYVLSNERLLAFQAGCDEFISKPIRLEVLFKLLRKYLG
jgi:two-component system, cell cycle response regulator DivK